MVGEEIKGRRDKQRAKTKRAERKKKKASPPTGDRLVK
jgi:hypothetical protein